jgi:hypothetical protein
MTIEITYLLPEFKTKIICILAANGTSQISMNAPSRENIIHQEIMDQQVCRPKVEFLLVTIICFNSYPQLFQLLNQRSDHLIQLGPRIIWTRYNEPYEHMLIHYTRILKRRCALTKKGDTRSSCLRCCVTHYNVIGDAHLCASLISQYRRRVSHQVEKLRHVIYVARLTLDDCLSYCGTSKRRMFSEACLRLSYALNEFL